MDPVLRLLTEKAQILTSGDTAIAEKAYWDVTSSIAGLEDHQTKELLFQSILATTALLSALSRHVGRDPIQILDGLQIGTGDDTEQSDDTNT